MTRPDALRRGLATVAVSLAVAALPAAAVAQSSDPELSCVPDSVAAGTSTACTVAGVAASRAVDLELRSGTTVVATARGVAGTDGAVTIALDVPADAPTGALSVALVGTSVAVPVTVTPARPSGVSAGLGPSTGEVARTLPAAAVLAAALTLGLASLPGLRRRAARPGDAA